MSERQRFDLVKSLVAIEKKLLGIKFAAHGGIYYKSTHPDGPTAIGLDQLPNTKNASRIEIRYWADDRAVVLRCGD